MTDWLEDYVLRTAGPDVYDQWVSHDVKFSDPQIADALTQIGDLIKNPKYVNAGFGDVKTIASTEFKDGGAADPAGQVLLATARRHFHSNFKPAGTTVGPDGDVNAFYFPPINDRFGKPVLGGGDLRGASPIAPRSGHSSTT